MSAGSSSFFIDLVPLESEPLHPDLGAPFMSLLVCSLQEAQFKGAY